MKKHGLLKLTAVAATAVSLAACSGGGNGGANAPQGGSASAPGSDKPLAGTELVLVTANHRGPKPWPRCFRNSSRRPASK